MGLPGTMIGILSQDYRLHVMERGVVKGIEDTVAGRVDCILLFLLHQEFLQLLEIGGLELIPEHLFPPCLYDRIDLVHGEGSYQKCHIPASEIYWARSKGKTDGRNEVPARCADPGSKWLIELVKEIFHCQGKAQVFARLKARFDILGPPGRESIFRGLLLIILPVG